MDGESKKEGSSMSVTTCTSPNSKGKSNGNNLSLAQYARRIQEQNFSFGGWKITVLKSSILPSNCYCNMLDKDNTKGLLLELGREFESVKLPGATGTECGSNAESLPAIKCHVCRYSEQLTLKHFPDMVFPDNCLHLLHESSGIVVEFNTLNAMKLISLQDTESIKVACSEAWQASKTESGLPKEVLHDYNWTYSTDYKGTLRSLRNGTEITVVNNPPEQLNIEKLKQRENILFYEEVTLFEDELHDSGISNLNVKLRVMPSGFFILLRYTLRVDHVMARVCDTRIHYEMGNNYFLRQFQTKQASFKNMGEVDPHQFSDINALAQYLPTTSEVTEKILLQ